jgi:hypothetical protein
MEGLTLETSQKIALAKGKAATTSVQPLELSERSDSGAEQRNGVKRAGRHANLEKATLVVVDRTLVDEAAAWITARVSATLKLGAREVGEYILDRFFRSDPTLAKSKNPHKNASFRLLAEKCGTPELPISKTWLNNAVGVALMTRQLPATATAFKELPPSYQETLLPLRDPTKVEKLAKLALSRELSFRELRQTVAEERSKLPKGKSRGRPASPIVIKVLRQSLKSFVLAGGKRSFTKADVEELDEQQREDALEAAETLLDKLKDLVSKLKEM